MGTKPSACNFGGPNDILEGHNKKLKTNLPISGGSLDLPVKFVKIDFAES